ACTENPVLKVSAGVLVGLIWKDVGNVGISNGWSIPVVANFRQCWQYQLAGDLGGLALPMRVFKLPAANNP
ncbi:MAG: hypothetical protein ABIV25_05415, partial [Paracoccaceae bacterium]